MFVVLYGDKVIGWEARRDELDSRIVCEDCRQVGRQILVVVQDSCDVYCTVSFRNVYTLLLKTSRTPKAYIPLPCLNPSKLLSDVHHTHHLPGQSTRGRSQGLCKANI